MKKKYSPLKKSPLKEVKLSQEEYLELVEKIKNGTANRLEFAKGQNGLFLKYCHCIRKSQALEKKKPKSKRIPKKMRSKKNEYAVCRHSIYKNRDIEPSMRFKGKKLKHKSLAYNCKKEFDR